MNLNEFVNAKFTEAGIEIVFYENPMCEPKMVIDTTKHDAEIRANERKAISDFVDNYKKDLDNVYEKGKIAGIKEFAEWLAENVGFECADCVRCFNCKEGTCVENLLEEYKRKVVLNE